MKRPLLVALGLSCLSCLWAVVWTIWQHQVSADGLSQRWIVVDVLNGSTLAIGRQGQFQQARLCGIQVAPVHDGEAKALLQGLIAQVEDSVQIVAVDRDPDKTLVAEIYTIPSSGDIFFQEALLLDGLAVLDSNEVQICPNAFSMQAAAEIARTSQSARLERRWRG